MKNAYHRFMLTTALLFAALSFRLGVVLMGVAVKHKSKMDLPIPVFQPRDRDEDIDWDLPPTSRSNVTWLDAMPEQCPLCGKAETCEECRA